MRMRHERKVTNWEGGRRVHYIVVLASEEDGTWVEEIEPLLVERADGIFTPIDENLRDEFIWMCQSHWEKHQSS